MFNKNNKNMSILTKDYTLKERAQIWLIKHVLDHKPEIAYNKSINEHVIINTRSTAIEATKKLQSIEFYNDSDFIEYQCKDCYCDVYAKITRNSAQCMYCNSINICLTK